MPGFSLIQFNCKLVCYRIRIRDNKDGYWKDYLEIFPKTEVEELVRRCILFWKRRVVKKFKNQDMTENAARVKAIRISRKLHKFQDTRLYEVIEFGDGRLSSYRIWENGKFTDY